MPRHGATTPGALARAQGTGLAETPEELAIERAAADRTRELLSGIPPRWRARSAALVRCSASPTEMLSAAAAEARSVRERTLEAYAAAIRDEARAHKRAIALRRKAARESDAEARAELLRDAALNDSVRADHALFLRHEVALLEAERKALDSIAQHSPTGHARVHVQIMAGAAQVWGAGPTQTYVGGYSAADEAILQEMEGAPAEDPARHQ